MYGLHDIVSELAKLSLVFQREHLTPDAVPAAVDRIKDWLGLHFCGAKLKCPSVDQFWRSLVVDVDGTEVRYKDHLLDLGYSSTRCKTASRTFSTVVAEVHVVLKAAATTVIKGLTERFPHSREVSMFNIFDVRKWPKSTEEMYDFGESGTSRVWLMSLGTQYCMQPDRPGQVCDRNEFTMEWSAFKMLVYRELSSSTVNDSADLRSFWLRVIDDRNVQDNFPNCVTMITIYLILPVNSADAERVFSAQNRLKTRIRNQLSTNLEASVRIHMEAPCINQFDFNPVVKRWHEKAAVRGRRFIAPAIDLSCEPSDCMAAE